MPLPVSISTKTITGHYKNFLGVVGVGTVDFTPNAAFIKEINLDLMIFATTMTATLDANGEFSIPLPVTDDPDVVPTFMYDVVENIVGAVRRQYSIYVPLALGASADLSDLVAVGTPPSGTTALTQTTGDARYIRTINGIGPDVNGDVVVTGGGGGGSGTPETASPTALTLAKRDASGRTQFANPAASQDAATKGYVDGIQSSLQTQITENSSALVTLGGNMDSMFLQVQEHETALPLKADLVGGLIPTAQLPPLAITKTQTVASQAAMLALDAQEGDVALRTDLDPDGWFILTSNSPSTLADWKQITAVGAVSAVAGKTGNVSLVKADVGLNLVDNTADADKPVSTAVSTQLGLKAPLNSPAFTGTPTGITKAHVGLNLVDNTADASKPVSTAQAAADTAARNSAIAYGGYVHIFANSSTTYPTKASSIPAGYAGRIWWHDEDYVAHPGPTEQVASDRHTKASA